MLKNINVKAVLQGVSIVIGTLAFFLLAAEYDGKSMLDLLLSKIVALGVMASAMAVYDYLENGGEQ